MCSTPDGPRHSARPSADAFTRNWRESEHATPKKMWLVARNTAKKVVTLKSCCGNFGEPGC